MVNMLDQLDSFLGGDDEKDEKREVQMVPGQTSGVTSSIPVPPIGGDDAGSLGESARSDTRSMSERPKESVFWIETVKIKPNPEQPRTTFY